jgi:hypothetical protein
VQDKPRFALRVHVRDASALPFSYFPRCRFRLLLLSVNDSLCGGLEAAEDRIYINSGLPAPFLVQRAHIRISFSLRY